jgi:glycolate oxidase
MTKQYAPDDMAIQMEIKGALDPHWLLNPAKVFPLEISRPHREAAKCA